MQAVIIFSLDYCNSSPMAKRLPCSHTLASSAHCSVDVVFESESRLVSCLDTCLLTCMCPWGKKSCILNLVQMVWKVSAFLLILSSFPSSSSFSSLPHSLIPFLIFLSLLHPLVNSKHVKLEHCSVSCSFLTPFSPFFFISPSLPPIISLPLSSVSLYISLSFLSPKFFT